MTLRLHLPVAFLLLLPFILPAQDKPGVVYGKISASDFDLSHHRFDTSASAVVIAETGDSHYESPLRMVFVHYRRVKILRKEGFDAATVLIPYIGKDSRNQRVFGIKAATYNLENGKVTQSKLDDKSVFTENFTGNLMVEKFTLPSVKEGSILEYTYSIESPAGLTLHSWEFQGKYPCLWSEYNVSFPTMYEYVTLMQGYLPFFVNKTGRDAQYGMNVNTHRWVMKDIEALKQEHFITSMDNYGSKVEFQLASILQPNGITQNILPSWQHIGEQLMASESFGAELKMNNGWLKDDLEPVTRGAKSDLEKAEKIYAFARDQFKCVQHSGVGLSNNLRNIFRNRGGSASDINILLTAMLIHEGILSSPVILSTRPHGYPYEMYPILSRYNYVICEAVIDSAVYFLDASEENLSFNHLPDYCYNGQAMIINKQNPLPVYFLADSLKEAKKVSVFIANDEKAKEDISGSFEAQPGYYEAMKIRRQVSGSSSKEYFQDLKSGFRDEFQIQNEGIDSLKQPDYPISVHFDFLMKNIGKADMIYFNPVMAASFKENPLKSTERLYPVEMPYAIDDVYVLNMDIPENFVVEEMPKSEKFLLNGSDGYYEYIIDKDETTIHLHTRIKLNRATFPVNDYSALRDFFTHLVTKQNEQIVFRKKK